MRTNIPFVVISAERGEYTPAVNQWRTESLASQLEARDLRTIPMDGVYQGKAERSFLVFLPPEHAAYTLTMLRQLGRRWGQESILHVDANRGAELLYMDERTPIDLGQWQTVSAAEAANADGYTYSPDTDSYYLARVAQ
jgi:hypothetical protein